MAEIPKFRHVHIFLKSVRASTLASSHFLYSGVRRIASFAVLSSAYCRCVSAQCILWFPGVRRTLLACGECKCAKTSDPSSSGTKSHPLFFLRICGWIEWLGLVVPLWDHRLWWVRPSSGVWIFLQGVYKIRIWPPSHKIYFSQQLDPNASICIQRGLLVFTGCVWMILEGIFILCMMLLEWYASEWMCGNNWNGWNSGTNYFPPKYKLQYILSLLLSHSLCTRPVLMHHPDLFKVT